MRDMTSQISPQTKPALVQFSYVLTIIGLTVLSVRRVSCGILKPDSIGPHFYQYRKPILQKVLIYRWYTHVPSLAKIYVQVVIWTLFVIRQGSEKKGEWPILALCE